MPPIVSVNLSDQAYSVYRGWKDHRNGSMMISAAVLQHQIRSDNLPMLEVGDRRTLADGNKLIWTEDGWGLE